MAMLRTAFEPTIPVFQRSEILGLLDAVGAASVIGFRNFIYFYIRSNNT
jgi:hypothetical protein